MPSSAIRLTHADPFFFPPSGSVQLKAIQRERARDPQFLPELDGELAQQFFTVRSKSYKYFTTILLAVPACHPPCSTRRSTNSAVL